MTLSEAIRLGALLKPQRVLDFESDDASCALRAAADAVGLTGYPIPYTELWRKFDVLHKWAACPVDGCWSVVYVDAPIAHVIMHLNDQHEWTRERIADWVEGFELEPEGRSAKVREEIPNDVPPDHVPPCGVLAGPITG